eukprot:XP_027306056.1 pre-mRNA-splicing factor 38B-like [Anas platyrhynchos]
MSFNEENEGSECVPEPRPLPPRPFPSPLAPRRRRHVTREGRGPSRGAGGVAKREGAWPKRRRRRARGTGAERRRRRPRDRQRHRERVRDRRGPHVREGGGEDGLGPSREELPEPPEPASRRAQTAREARPSSFHPALLDPRKHFWAAWSRSVCAKRSCWSLLPRGLEPRSPLGFMEVLRSSFEHCSPRPPRLARRPDLRI